MRYSSEGKPFLYRSPRTGALHYRPTPEQPLSQSAIYELPVVSPEQAHASLNWQLLRNYAPDKDIAEAFLGRVGFAGSDKFGKGHRAQELIIAEAGQSVGMRMYGGAISDLVDPWASFPTRAVMAAYAGMNDGTGLSHVYELAKTADPSHLLTVQKIVQMIEFSESFVRKMGIDYLYDKHPVYDAINGLMVAAVRSFPWFNEWMHRDLSATANAKHFDYPMASGFDKFLSLIGAHHVFAAHASVARAATKTHLADNTTYFLGDDGFAGNDTIILPFVPISGTPTIIPFSPAVRSRLEGTYRVPSHTIIEAGMLSNIVDADRVQKKWGNSKNERRIVISLSGNGNGLDLMNKAVIEFVQYRDKHPDSNQPYRLVLLPGIKSDKAKERFAEVQRLLDRTGLSQSGEVELYWASDIRQYLDQIKQAEEEAILEVSKGGEQTGATQSMGIVHLVTKGHAPHEDVNAACAFEKFGTSIPIPWNSSREHWERQDWIQDALHSDRLLNGRFFHGHKVSLFEQLDYMFGDRELSNGTIEREATGNPLKEIAYRAYQSAHLGAAVVGLASAMGPVDPDKYNIRGQNGIYIAQRLQDFARGVSRELRTPSLVLA